jgi:hypothetical protein
VPSVQYGTAKLSGKEYKELVKNGILEVHCHCHGLSEGQCRLSLLEMLALDNSHLGCRQMGCRCAKRNEAYACISCFDRAVSGGGV